MSPTFSDMYDDVAVQELVRVVWRQRDLGVTWDQIEANLERLEEEAECTLDEDERQTFLDGVHEMIEEHS